MIANTVALALKQPTNPDSANESSASSTHMDATLAPAQNLAPNGPTPGNNTNNQPLLNTNGVLTPGATGLSAVSNGPPSASMMSGLQYGETNYDFFDPQNWMLDGLVDFNYSFVAPLEGN